MAMGDAWQQTVTIVRHIKATVHNFKNKFYFASSHHPFY